MIKKNLKEWLSYLESIHPSEIDMGLARVRQVGEALDVLEPANKIVVVAGTNGKGSTVTYCSSILKESGLSVGCYMSPHLHIYNERVQINGNLATDEDLIESFEAIDAARGDITLTYFEVGTLSALYLFKKHRVDAAILEVGLGGRLDAVNIVDADVSVVTSIGLDHQDWLGDDLSVIATEKAGVFRKGMPAICGQENVPASLPEYAKNLGANYLHRGRNFDLIQREEGMQFFGVDHSGQKRVVSNIPDPVLPLINLPTAIQVLIQLVPELTDSQIIEGINKAKLAGRLETFSVPFQGMLDVGHNAQAAELLSDYLSKSTCIGKRRVVLAMLEDKDPLSVVAALAPVVDEWHLAGLSGFRGQTVEALNGKVQGRITAQGLHQTVHEALSTIKRLSCPDDEVVILGSFVTVAQAREWLEEHRNG